MFHWLYIVGSVCTWTVERRCGRKWRRGSFVWFSGFREFVNASVHLLTRSFPRNLWPTTVPLVSDCFRVCRIRDLRRVQNPITEDPRDWRSATDSRLERKHKLITEKVKGINGQETCTKSDRQRERTRILGWQVEVILLRLEVDEW